MPFLPVQKILATAAPSIYNNDRKESKVHFGVTGEYDSRSDKGAKEKGGLMKRIFLIIAMALVLSCAAVYLVYAQGPAAAVKTKAVDIDNDGKADVTYYSDGEQVTKAQADTNKDGKPDVTVDIKDGKFKSAEVDTNNDGKAEKNFNDLKSFDNWLNENHPDYDRTLNRGDWSMESVGF